MAISKAAIVGAGVMGEAMINALSRMGVHSGNVVIKEKRTERERELIYKYGVKAGTLEDSELIILSVKPQDLEKTLNEISGELRDGALLISLLAGVKSSRIENLIGEGVRVVRVMPNTPILVGLGMSVIAPGKSSIKSDIDLVESLLSKSGATLVVDEELMDAVTATSGSGPAYFFGFVEAMIEAATKLGLKDADAKLLITQTLLGAAKMISESGKDAKTLRENVTSPNGTTDAALSVFESNDWTEIVYQAMKAARDRSRELSN